MLKRRAKQNARKTFKIFFYFLFCGIFISALVIGFQKIAPLFQTGETDGKGEIIIPVGESVTIDDIRVELEQKGFLMESIMESSKSAAVMATMRDGVKVYFSKDQAADYQVSALKLILQRLKVENKVPALIDLRERRPIVKFK